METLIQDLRFGFRMLIREKGFTAVAVLALALGIGANTAIFTIVNAVLLRPLPYPNSEELMQLGRSFVGEDAPSDVSAPKFNFLRNNLASFEAITATQEMGPNVILSDEIQTEYIRGLVVTAEFFRVLGVHPASGRAFTMEVDSFARDRVAILGDGIWRRRFGADPGFIGRTIALNGVTHTVVGVMPPGFDYNGEQDVLLPSGLDSANQNEGHNWTVIGRLKSGVTPEQARAEAATAYESFKAAYPRQVDPKEYFGVVSWQANMTNSSRQLLFILLGAVSFVLLIACANVANLQLARASGRQKEVAVRIALGASGWRVVRQLLTEGVVLALMGGSAGLILAIWVLDAVLAILPENMIPRAAEISLDLRVLAFTIGMSLLTGIVSGLAPALQTLRVDVNRALKEAAGKGGQSPARGRLRSVLVVAEVSLSLALMVGAGLLLRTFANLRGVEPGFEASNVLTVEVAARGKSYDTMTKINGLYGRALESFRSLPGVEAVALTNKLPLDRWFNLPYKLAGQSEWTGSTEYRLISPDYFRVMEMALRQGRSFDESDTAGSEPVIIVNEAFARRNFVEVDSLGQQLCVDFVCGDRTLRRVVGVVNETKQRGLVQAAPATVFIPLSQTPENLKQVAQQSSFVLRTAGDPLLLSAAVRGELHQLDPLLPIKNVRSMEQLVSGSIAPQRFNLFLLGLFALVGLVLAAVGVYGVMAYSVSQRTHEIGIRMALGAEMRDVMKMVMAHGMALIGAGVALGLAGAFALSRVMDSLLFGVSARDFTTFGVTALLLGGVALGACLVPARRAAKVDPMIALRYE
jgi:putative ABC transport system permease protein